MELASKYETSDPEISLKYYSKLNNKDKVKTLATNLMESFANDGDFQAASNYARMAGNSKAEASYRDASEFLAQ